MCKRILAVFIVLLGSLFAQTTGGGGGTTGTNGFSIQIQNAGSVLASFRKFLVLNCSGNVTCSLANGVVTVAGVATGFSGVPSGACTNNQFAINTLTGVVYFCSSGTWTAIANNTFPVSATVSGSGTVATLTIVPGTATWPGAYQSGASISVTGCSTSGFNVTAAITGGTFGTGGTVTYANATSGTGTGCTVNVAAGAGGGTITGVTPGTGLTGGGSSGNVTLNLSLPVASATTAAQLNGIAIPPSKTIVGTDAGGHIVDATSATLPNNINGNAATATLATNATNATTAASTTGNAGTATTLQSTPSNCGPGIAATGITANGTPVNCFTPSGTLPGGTQQGTVAVTDVGPGFSEKQQTKPLPDTRDDSLAGANVCQRYNDLGNAAAVFPVAATSTQSAGVVTLTTASGNWPSDYVSGVTNNLIVTGCSVAGQNGTFTIASITPPSNVLTYANATAGSSTGCQVFYNLGTINPIKLTLEGEISNVNAPCVTTNIDNPKTQAEFNAQTVLNTDIGFTIGTWQELKGVLTDVVGVQGQVNQTGSALKATSLFPNVNLTATGTSGQSTISITNTSGDAFNLSPGTAFNIPFFQVTGVGGTCIDGTNTCVLDGQGTVTLTCGSPCTTGHWGSAFSIGAVITVTNCANATYDITTPILTGGSGNTTLTYFDTEAAIPATTTGCVVNLATGDGVAGGYYYVSKCVFGSAFCSNTVAGVNTSQFYSVPANGTITVNIKPALASSPSGPINLFQPIANLGDITSQNQGQTGIANDWSRVTGFHINGTNIPTQYTCIGGMDPFAQEGSWFRDVTVAGCGIGIWLPQSVDSGPYEDINVGYSATAKCAGVTIPFQITAQATSVRRVTINGNNCSGSAESLGLLHITDSPYNASTIPGGLVIEQFHMEGAGQNAPGTTNTGILVDSMYAGGNGATGTVLIQGGVTCPPVFPCTNGVELAASFNGTLGLHQIEVQQGGGSVNTFKNDITGNTYLVANNKNGNASGIGFMESDLTGSEFSNQNPTDMQNGQAANVYNGIFHSTVMTQHLTADSAGITAITALTAATQFSWANLVAGQFYSFHCSGTTTQATAGGGIGIAIQTTGHVATNMEAHATVATGPAAAAYSSSGSLSTTTYSQIYTGSTGTLTTQLPWEVDGSIEVGAIAPTALNIGFFSASASDAVVVKRDSYCALTP